MTPFDQARERLRAYLQDMDALKPYADPGNPDAAPFVAAFAAARDRALKAASDYCTEAPKANP